MGSLNEVLSDSDRSELANSLLCFLLCGLHARFRIPVGYFFTRRCTGALLAETTKHVIKKTEELGFEIVRIVSDNHKTNVAAMEILSRGQPQTRVPHPTVYRIRSEPHHQKRPITVPGKKIWEKWRNFINLHQGPLQDAAGLYFEARPFSHEETPLPTEHRKNGSEACRPVVFTSRDSGFVLYERPRGAHMRRKVCRRRPNS